MIFSSLLYILLKFVTLGRGEESRRGTTCITTPTASHIDAGATKHASTPSIPQTTITPTMAVTPCRRVAPRTSIPHPFTHSQHSRGHQYLFMYYWRWRFLRFNFLPWRCRSTRTSPRRLYVPSQPDVSLPPPTRRSWTTLPLAVAWPCTGPGDEKRDAWLHSEARSTCLVTMVIAKQEGLKERKQNTARQDEVLSLYHHWREERLRCRKDNGCFKEIKADWIAKRDKDINFVKLWQKNFARGEETDGEALS